MRMVVDKLCEQHNLRFKSVISVNGLDAVAGLVKRGVGGAFVLKSLVADEFRRKELQESKVQFNLPLAVALATARDDHGDEVVRMLKKWL